MLTCFAKCDLLIDVFVVTNQANYKTTREFITEVGIALEQVILELLGSFTLERRAFRYLSRENDSTHHVGFPLSPFTDFFYAYMVIIPLCIQLNLHQASSNQSSEILVEKNGKLNLY